jgi:hypothetical protein
MEADEVAPPNDPRRFTPQPSTPSKLEKRTWHASAPRWRQTPPIGLIRPCEPTLADRPSAGPAGCTPANRAALIDGEAVVFRDDGRADFHALLTKRGWLIALFVAFGLLRLNSDDQRQHSLEKRRDAARAAHRQRRRKSC